MTQFSGKQVCFEYLTRKLVWRFFVQNNCETTDQDADLVLKARSIWRNIFGKIVKMKYRIFQISQTQRLRNAFNKKKRFKHGFNRCYSIE
jgi:hypothetical protein